MAQLFLTGRIKHSLEISGAVGLHELLFGSQEDVGFKPGNKSHHCWLLVANAAANAGVFFHLLSSLTSHPG